MQGLVHCQRVDECFPMGAGTSLYIMYAYDISTENPSAYVYSAQSFADSGCTVPSAAYSMLSVPCPEGSCCGTNFVDVSSKTTIYNEYTGVLSCPNVAGAVDSSLGSSSSFSGSSASYSISALALFVAVACFAVALYCRHRECYRKQVDNSQIEYVALPSLTGYQTLSV